MTDLISVHLEQLKVGDYIPQLKASVVEVTQVKVGRTARVIRNNRIILSDGRVLLSRQRITLTRTPDGRLTIPWDSSEVPSPIGVLREPDPN